MDDVLILCRVCLNKGEISIFREACFKDSIRDRLMACTSIRVDLNDGFPPNICTQCLSELDNAYNFRLKCERSEKKLMEYFGVFTNTVDNEHKLCTENETIDSTTVQCDIKAEVLECVESIKIEYDQDYYKANVSRNMTLKSEPICSQSEHSKTLENGGGNISISKLKRKMSETLHRTQIEKCKVPQPGNRFNMEKPKERDKTQKYMCTNLLDHERVHLGDKPYSCNICNRKFAQSGHLMVHVRTHTRDKSYHCEVFPSESPHDRKLRINRERMQRWRKGQSLETLQRLAQQSAETKRRRRQKIVEVNESPQEHKLRINRERMQRWRKGQNQETLQRLAQQSVETKRLRWQKVVFM